MIDYRTMMMFAGCALTICAFGLSLGLIGTMTGGNIWWAVPAMGVTGAALSGGSGLAK